VQEEHTLEELVRYIAQSLVDDPGSVLVERYEKDQTVIIELHVAPDDMGKVIGKQGRIAKAIRAVVKAATAKEEKRYQVEIV
jgi:hypothetical protein